MPYTGLTILLEKRAREPREQSIANKVSRRFRRTFGLKPRLKDYPELKPDVKDVAGMLAPLGVAIGGSRAAFEGISRLDAPVDLGDTKLLSKLRNAFGVKGLRIFPAENIISLNKNTGSAYYPSGTTGSGNPMIGLARKGGKRRLGTLAHELGHASGKPFRGYISQGGGLGRYAPLAAIMGTSSTNEPIAAASALGGTAMMVPTLAEELRASLRGARKLKQLGLGGLRGRLGAFAGLGTYAGMASLPAISYLSNKRLGLYDKDSPRRLQSDQLASDTRAYRNRMLKRR
jgi:hypothetical protein